MMVASGSDKHVFVAAYPEPAARRVLDQEMDQNCANDQKRVEDLIQQQTFIAAMIASFVGQGAFLRAEL